MSGINRIAAKLGKLNLKSPVTDASGTFGLEYGQLFPLGCLGAYVTKTITKYPKEGNKPPRLVETPSGLLNSIGLQNPGIVKFIAEVLPECKAKLLYKHDTAVPLIVSFSGSTQSEFIEVLEKLEQEKGIAGYEVNISCPNVEKEGISFGVDAQAVYNLTSSLAGVVSDDRELTIKLTPNVTDITEIALAAYEGGADSLALINTALGMAIDWQTGSTKLSRGFGGLSGPAIKPIALYNVFKVANAVKIPILAMGGITTWEDALEFFYAGASAVAIGTANFINPLAITEITDGLERFCRERSINLVDIIGKIKIMDDYPLMK